MTSAADPNAPAALLSRVGHTALITLNRPKAMNAVNQALSQAVGEALEAAQQDKAVRAVVITGSGRAFCAGADLKAIASGEDIFAPNHADWGFAGLVRHYIDKPLIAAVNGYALGGGTEIVLACDLAVISAEASLGLPEVKRGLVAAGGGLLRLHRQIPRKLALEMVLTGEPISAQVAAQVGLVNRVVSPSAVIDTAMELAAAIAENAPLAVQVSKRIAYRSNAAGDDWQAAMWDLNDQECLPVFSSHDAQEGPRAFAAKRPPVWRGE